MKKKFTTGKLIIFHILELLGKPPCRITYNPIYIITYLPSIQDNGFVWCVCAQNLDRKTDFDFRNNNKMSLSSSFFSRARKYLHTHTHVEFAAAWRKNRTATKHILYYIMYNVKYMCVFVCQIALLHRYCAHRNRPYFTSRNLDSSKSIGEATCSKQPLREIHQGMGPRPIFITYSIQSKNVFNVQRSVFAVNSRISIQN